MAESAAIPGIGPWTVQGALLLAPQCEDVVLPGDLALRKTVQAAYAGPPPCQQEVLAIAEKWRPYRSLATSYLVSAAFEPAEVHWSPGSGALDHESAAAPILTGSAMSRLRLGVARTAWLRDAGIGCICGSARNAVMSDAVTTLRGGTRPRTSAWPGIRSSGRTNRARTGIGATSTSLRSNSRVPRRHRRTREGSGRTDVDVRLRRPPGHAGRGPAGHADLPRRVRDP